LASVSIKDVKFAEEFNATINKLISPEFGKCLKKHFHGAFAPSFIWRRGPWTQAIRKFTFTKHSYRAIESIV